MTWDELLERLAKAGIPFNGIDEDVMGYITIHTDFKLNRDGGGREYLAIDGEFADDVEE